MTARTCECFMYCLCPDGEFSDAARIAENSTEGNGSRRVPSMNPRMRQTRTHDDHEVDTALGRGLVERREAIPGGLPWYEHGWRWVPVCTADDAVDAVDGCI